VLISHTLKYLPAQLLSPLAQLASMIVWTHWLSPTEMGVFTLVTVTQELAYIGCLGWFSIYALRYLPAKTDVGGRLRYLHTENAVVLASLAATAVVAAVTAWVLPGEQAFGPSALAIAAFFASRALSTHYAERARAQASFVSYTLLQTAGPVGGLVLGWWGLQHVDATAVVLLSAYAVAQTVGVLLALPGLGLNWRWPQPDRALLRAALAFGGPLLGLGALGWVAENYIRYLVQWHSGAAALGLMIVGWSLGRRCASVTSLLVVTASFPLAARLLNQDKRSEALGYLSLNAAMMIGVLLPMTVAVELLGPTLIKLFVATQYQDMTAEVLGLSVLAGALRNLHIHTTDQLMVLERRIGMLAKLDVVEIGLCAVFSLVGLYAEGVRGAVIGQALGSLLTLGLSLWLAHHRLGFRWPWRDTAKVTLASTVMLLALYALPYHHDLPGLVLASSVGAVVYGLACGLLFAPALRRLWASRGQSQTA